MWNQHSKISVKNCQYWLKKLGIILIYPFGQSTPVENTDEIISKKIQIIHIEIGKS